MSTKLSQPPILTRVGGTLSTLADIALAPKSATNPSTFSGSLLTAFALLIGLVYAGMILERPVTEHVIEVMIEKQLSAHPGADPQAAAQTSRDMSHVYATIGPVIGFAVLVAQQFIAAGLITLAVMLVNGRANYGKFLYVYVHTSVLSIGLGQLALGAIHFLRGPESYQTALSMQLSMPSLAWLVPVPPPATVVLAAVNPFTIWQIAILTFWIAYAAKLSKPVAGAIAAIPLCLFTGVAAMYAGG